MVVFQKLTNLAQKNLFLYCTKPNFCAILVVSKQGKVVITVEERNENKHRAIKAIIIILVILGLISAVVVVLGYLYKKFKKAIASFNEDIGNEELSEQDLTDLRGKSEQEHAAGCQINCAD